MKVNALKLTSVVGALVGALLLSSCGKVDEVAKDVGQRAKAPRLMNTWAGSCHGVNIPGTNKGLTERSFMQFSGATFYEAHEVYEGRDCQGQALARVLYDGKFDLNQSRTVAGADDLDLHYQRAQVVALNQTGADWLGGLHFCGRPTWQINQAQVVQPGGLGCPLKTIPSDEFNLAKTESDTVFFGKVTLGNELSDTHKRPTQLDQSAPFHKVDRKFD